VLWAGSDDGLLHVSRDEGKTWRLEEEKHMRRRSAGRAKVEE